MIQWKRTDLHDGASEVLRLVVQQPAQQYFCSELGREYPYLLQVSTGPDLGDDLVGLFDLDGNQVPLPSGSTWEVCTEAPPEVLEHIEAAWECGLNVVERIL